jgi:hypothetical protein
VKKSFAKNMARFLIAKNVKIFNASTKPIIARPRSPMNALIANISGASLILDLM